MEEGTRIQEADWDGDFDRYYADQDQQHPNLLAMLTVEQWVSSDADIVRGIKFLSEVLLARGETH